MAPTSAWSNADQLIERISTRLTVLVQRHQLCNVTTVVPFVRLWIVDGAGQPHDAVGVLNGIGAK
jgi:hypothetical protein